MGDVKQNITVNNGEAVTAAVTGFIASVTELADKATTCLKDLKELGPGCGAAVEKFVEELSPIEGELKTCTDSLEDIRKQWADLREIIELLDAVKNESLED